MKHVYGGKNCPTFGPNLYEGGPDNLCLSNTSDANYGYYEAGGHWVNDTVEVLTKDQVTTGIPYQCDDVQAPKMLFNGMWYCYCKTSASASYDNIANNYCNSVYAGSTVIKALSLREYRYVKYLDNSVVYIGLILPSGATSFTW
ncbi:hypothetical protein AAVH_19286 [Aphelenchoides avenae]|nr:hypothetical protein AAVH_19286 [Aphelenchus avenae]